MEGATPDNRLFDFLTNLKEDESADRAWHSTVTFMRALGASRVGVSMELDSADPLFMWTFPPWVAEQYMEEVYPDCDPTLAHCRENVAPFFSGTAFLHRYPDPPTPYRQYLEDLVSEEVRSSVVIPLHTCSNGEWGKFSFSTNFSADEFESGYAERGIMIHMASIAAFNRIRTLVKKERAAAVGLTRRERECLLWLARGLRNDQIAERMGIRPVTVAFHFANARSKLNARTREQTLVSAIQLGLVCP